MTFDSTTMCRVNNAIERVQNQFAETVYVYHFASPSVDGVYQEDLPRTEKVYRCFMIANRNPSPRLLSKFGRKRPVDVMFTLGWNQAQNAALLNPANSQYTPTGFTNGYPQMGDHIVYHNVRYTIVKVGPEMKATNQPGVTVPVVTPGGGDDSSDSCGIPDAGEGAYTVTQDQTAQFLELYLMAVITSAPDINVTATVETEPTVTAIAATSNTTIRLTLSAPVQLVGDPRYQLRVAVLGAYVAQNATTLLDSTHVEIVVPEAFTTGTTVTVTYANQPDLTTLVNGIALASSATTELQPYTGTVSY